MKESRLKHFIDISLGTFISMFIGLLTTPIITRLVSPDEYGRLSLFTLYGSFALTVMCMGLDQALVRYFYKDESEAYKKELFQSCILPPLLSWCAVGAAALLIDAAAVHIFKAPFRESIPFLALFIIYVINLLLNRFILLSFRLQYKTKEYALLGILTKTAYLAAALSGIFIIRGYYFWILAAATVFSYLAANAIAVFRQRKLAFGSVKSSGLFTVRELLKYGYPFIFYNAVTTLFEGIDKISLQLFTTYGEVGVYASATTLVNIFAVIQSSFYALWQPMAIEHFEKSPEDKEFYRKVNQYITVLVFVLGISLIFVKDLFALLLGEKYRAAACILPFLIFRPIMCTISETTVSGIYFYQKSKLHIRIAAVACVANIAGNFLLIPFLGARGAAISTGLSYIVFFAMRTVLSNRLYYVNWHIKKLSALTAATIAYAGYCTFFPFGAGSAAGFAAVMLLLILLYRSTIAEMFLYVKQKFLKRS